MWILICHNPRTGVQVALMLQKILLRRKTRGWYIVYKMLGTTFNTIHNLEGKRWLTVDGYYSRVCGETGTKLRRWKWAGRAEMQGKVSEAPWSQQDQSIFHTGESNVEKTLKMATYSLSWWRWIPWGANRNWVKTWWVTNKCRENSGRILGQHIRDGGRPIDS